MRTFITLITVLSISATAASALNSENHSEDVQKEEVRNPSGWRDMGGNQTFAEDKNFEQQKDEMEKEGLEQKDKQEEQESTEAEPRQRQEEEPNYRSTVGGAEGGNI